MILTKPISPKKLNDKAMRAVFVDEAKTVADEIELDFYLTVNTWKHQPDFEKIVEIGSAAISILVGTDNEIYRYVNDGTKRHWVEPKKAKALRFRSLYTAKTTPGKMVARSGGASGPFWYSKGHWVSGIDDRNFDEAIQKEWEPKFKSRMEDAMKKAAKVSGNEI